MCCFIADIMLSRLFTSLFYASQILALASGRNTTLSACRRVWFGRYLLACRNYLKRGYKLFSKYTRITTTTRYPHRYKIYLHKHLNGLLIVAVFVLFSNWYALCYG